MFCPRLTLGATRGRQVPLTAIQLSDGSTYNTDALLECLQTDNTTPIHKYLCNAPAMPAMVNVQFVIALHVLGILSMGDGFNLHLKHTAPDKLHIEIKTQDIVSSGDQTLPGSVTTVSNYIQTIVDDWNGYQLNIPQTSSEFTNTFAGDLQIKRIAHIFAVDGVVTALQICLREVCKLYTAGAGNDHVHITRFKQHASVRGTSQFKWLRVPGGTHSRYCPSPAESWPLYSSDTPNSIPALCGRYYGEISRYTRDGVQIVVSSESAQPWSDTVDHATQLLYPFRTLQIDVFFDGVKCEEWRPPRRSPFSSQSAAISVFVVPGNMSHVIVPSLSMLKMMLCGFTPMPGVDMDVASHAVSLLPTMLLHFAEEQAQTPIAVKKRKAKGDSGAMDGEQELDNEEVDGKGESDAASSIGTETTAGADADAATEAAHGPAIGGALKQKRSGVYRSKGGKAAHKKKRGFVDVPRKDFRRLEGRTAIVNGNQRSCGQDALVNCAKALGVDVTKTAVHAATLPTEGDTEVGVLVDHARDVLGIMMLDTRVPSTLGASLFQVKGGPEHALVQHTEGVFFVELEVSQEGKPDDYHAIVYNAGYTHPTLENIRGAIVDNEKDTPVKLLEPSDRVMVVDVESGRTVPAARKVFASLFPFASMVRVVGAWLMVVEGA